MKLRFRVRLLRRIFGKGSMFCLMIALLAIVSISIFHTNNVVENFSNQDFSDRRAARMITQIRAQLMKAFGSCHEVVKGDPLKNEEWADVCLSALDSTLSQFSDEYTTSLPTLKADLDLIYSHAEKLVELSGKSESKKEQLIVLTAFDEKVNLLFEDLGSIEASMWGTGSAKYAEMIRKFKWANQLGLVSVAVVVLLIIYFYLLNLLKEKADKKLERAHGDLELQKLALIQSSKMSALGEMATGIAHEINNPLAVIHTKAEKLRRLSKGQKLDPEKLEENVSVILMMSLRITKIIRGLREFARDGEGDPFTATPIDLIIEETIELCKSKLADHSVELQLDIPNPAPIVECRATQISQVILNLIGNAHDAIENHGEKKWIKVAVKEDGDAVKISIIDCGEGIPKAVQDKMFSPFYTTKEVGKGTGLGLSISVGIIKAHFGFIEVDNNMANTSISFTIPKVHPLEVKS